MAFYHHQLTAAQLVRSERRRLAREQKAIVMHDLSSDLAPEIDIGLLRLTLDEVVATLGSTDQEAVLLRFFEGQSFVEMGPIHGVISGIWTEGA